MPRREPRLLPPPADWPSEPGVTTTRSPSSSPLFTSTLTRLRMPVSTFRTSLAPEAATTVTSACGLPPASPRFIRTAPAGTTSTSRAAACTKKTCALIDVISSPSGFGTSKRAL